MFHVEQIFRSRTIRAGKAASIGVCLPLRDVQTANSIATQAKLRCGAALASHLLLIGFTDAAANHAKQHLVVIRYLTSTLCCGSARSRSQDMRGVGDGRTLFHLFNF